MLGGECPWQGGLTFILRFEKIGKSDEGRKDVQRKKKGMIDLVGSVGRCV